LAAFAASSQQALGAKNPMTLCRTLFKAIVVPYQSLYEMVDSRKVSPSPAVELTDLNQEQCQTPQTSRVVIRKTLAALSANTQKIGVLINQGSYKAEPIKAGLEAFFKSQGQALPNLVFKEITPTKPEITKAMAQLVYEDHVSLLINSLPHFASAVDELGFSLRIPMIHLTPRPKEKFSTYSYFVFPSESQLARRILDHIAQQSYKKVALLYPAGRHNSPLIEELVSGLAAHNVAVESAMYAPTDYNSMELAAKKLFKIDPVERSEEWLKLNEEAKKAAEENNVAFNPNSVVLPPINDYDAMILPDNFKNVRHFVKIFKFLGINSLKLIGNQEWRTPDLLVPPEPFLNNSVFVDFIGSYLAVPKPLVPQTQPDSPYFVAAVDAETIDFKIIAYHAGEIAYQAIAQATKRQAIDNSLAGLSNISQYFARGPVFDGSRQSTWPSYLFKVQGQQIQQIGD
jgi:hypothetical protein